MDAIPAEASARYAVGRPPSGPARCRDSAVRWLDMEAQSGNIAVRGPTEFRSFAVEAFVGRRATGWPLARFDVSGSELRVHLSFPWFTTRSQHAAAVRVVLLTRRLGDMCCIRFDDAAGSLGDVHVHPIYRRQQMIDELRRCGYEVVSDFPQGASRWRRRT
jgi:hypothetical protein